MTDPSFLASEVSKRAQRALSSIDRTAEHQNMHPLEVVRCYDERHDGWSILAHQAGVSCLGPHAQQAVRLVLEAEAELRGYECIIQAEENLRRQVSAEFTAGQGRTAMPPVPPLIANESETACLESKSALASGERSTQRTAWRSISAARRSVWRSSSPAPKAPPTIGWLSRLRRRSANSSPADAASFAGGAPTREDGEPAPGFTRASSMSVPAAPRSLNSHRAKEKGATGRGFGVVVAAGCAAWAAVLWFLRNWR